MPSFEATVLGGLPVEITYSTTGYANSDCGGSGSSDMDECYISAVNGRQTNTDWIYKRLGKDAEGVIYEKAREHQIDYQ